MKATVRPEYSIRKDDQVQVMSGKEKGKTGKVLRIYSKQGTVLIEKVNLVKRHMKASQANPQGGVKESERPLDYSNILIHCPKCNRGVRHGIKVVDSKSKKGAKKAKVRFCKKCKSDLDKA